MRSFTILLTAGLLVALAFGQQSQSPVDQTIKNIKDRVKQDIYSIQVAIEDVLKAIGNIPNAQDKAEAVKNVLDRATYHIQQITNSVIQNVKDDVKEIGGYASKY